MTAVGRATLHIYGQVLAHTPRGRRAVTEASAQIRASAGALPRGLCPPSHIPCLLPTPRPRGLQMALRQPRRRGRQEVPASQGALQGGPEGQGAALMQARPTCALLSMAARGAPARPTDGPGGFSAQRPARLRVRPPLFLLQRRVKGRPGGTAHRAHPAQPPALLWTELALPSEPLPANTSEQLETSLLPLVHCESPPSAWITPLCPQPPQAVLRHQLSADRAPRSVPH